MRLMLEHLTAQCKTKNAYEMGISITIHKHHDDEGTVYPLGIVAMVLSFPVCSCYIHNLVYLSERP
jgi:hypothetical protein